MADFTSTCHVGNKRRVNCPAVRSDGSPAVIQAGSFTATVLGGGDAVVVSFDDGGFDYAPPSELLSSVEIRADADLGAGVREIVATIDCQGLAAEATAFGGFSEGVESPNV